MWLLERIAWKIALWTYVPRWCLGTRLQRWCYGRNGRLLSWLAWRFECNLRDAEAILKDAEALLKDAEAEQDES